MSETLISPLEKCTIEDLDNYIVDLRENTGEDVMSARILLKESRDDGVLIDYCLTSAAMTGLWKKTADGKKGENIPLPKVNNVTDLLKRAGIMNLNTWTQLCKKNAEFNKLLTPDNLEK